MSDWSVAAAQSGSRPGDITWNIRHHLEFIRMAALHRIDLLLFPELSLTGYTLSQMADLAIALDDPVLHVFAEAAAEYQMGISIGLPLKSGGNVRLSAATFLPDGTRIAYNKRNLHGEEKRIFEQGVAMPMFGHRHRNVVVAICADISVGQFAQDAARMGADLYATSVLVSEQGYETDCEYLSRWSREYSMAVLMANHAWPTGGYAAAGKSAFWDADGHRVIQGGSGEQLIIARRSGNDWQGEVHPLPCRPEN